MSFYPSLFSTTTESISNSSSSAAAASASSSSLILHLAVASLTSILEIILEVSLGFILCKLKFVDASATSKVLSRLNYYLFFPCQTILVFVTTIDYEILKSYWITMVISLIYTFIGLIIGYFIFMLPSLIMRRLTRNSKTKRFNFWIRLLEKLQLPKIQQKILVLSVGYQNGGTLPLVYVAALVDSAFPYIKGGKEQALASILLFCAPISFSWWGWAKSFLKRTREDELEAIEAQETHVALDEELRDEELGEEAQSIEEEESVKPATSPVQSEEEQEEAADQSSIDVSTKKTSTPVVSSAAATSSSPAGFIANLKEFVKSIFNVMVGPATMSTVAGLVLCLIPFVKTFFLSPPPIASAFIRTIQSMNNAVFALSMVTLGANISEIMSFGKPDSKPATASSAEQQQQLEVSNNEQDDKHLKKQQQQEDSRSFFRKYIIRFNKPYAVLLSLFMRLILMPIVGIAIVYALVILGVIPKDPILILVLLNEAATPMAMSTPQLCNLNDDHGLSEATELLLTHYLLAPITLTVYSVLHLYISCNLTGVCQQ